MPKPFCFTIALVFGWLATSPATAADQSKPNMLTEKEIEEGWIDLFDGETTFGWKVVGDAKVVDGVWAVGGPKKTTLTTTTKFGPGKLHIEPKRNGKHGELIMEWGGGKGSSNSFTSHVLDIEAVFPPEPLVLSVPANDIFEFAFIRYKPHRLKPLFNNKDLTGWKVFDADPAKAKAKFEVTPAGELSVTGGPGDLQTDEKYADFVLQARAKTNRPLVNSGFFFRCVPNEFENGYEAQINNAIVNDDRTKPLDFGTGAVYRRVKARKVVPNDNEWFTLTVIAVGPHISTWVNGYQTVDWTDDRAPNANPRNGLRTEAGHISIQAHTPPTPADALFAWIRIAEWKAEKK